MPINIELSTASPLQRQGLVLALYSQVSGDRTERVTPVPIPNTEVKPLWADGTARAIVWETRSLPGLNRKPRHACAYRGFLLFQELLRWSERQVAGEERQYASLDSLRHVIGVIALVGFKGVHKSEIGHHLIQLNVAGFQGVL